MKWDETPMVSSGAAVSETLVAGGRLHLPLFPGNNPACHKRLAGCWSLAIWKKPTRDGIQKSPVDGCCHGRLCTIYYQASYLELRFGNMPYYSRMFSFFPDEPSVTWTSGISSSDR
jgi:hypothetical protein